MPLRFPIGIGSLGDENLILLTGLKETLKPKRERRQIVVLHCHMTICVRNSQLDSGTLKRGK